MFQDLEEEGPCNGVEGFGKIDLEEYRWDMSRLEVLAGQLDCTEIFMDPPSSDECGLIGLDEFGHPWSKPHREPFGEQFADGVYEADRPIVPQPDRRVGLLEQHHCGLVDVVEAAEV